MRRPSRSLRRIPGVSAISLASQTTYACVVADRKFRAALAGIVGVGLVGRVVYVFVAAPAKLVFSDALYYHLQGNLLANGHFFVKPFDATFDGAYLPSAVHPPLFSTILGAASTVGADSVRAHQIVGCILGAATVTVVGVCARSIIGARAGLLAAALAAIYPALWVNDGLVVSESASALLTAV